MDVNENIFNLRKHEEEHDKEEKMIKETLDRMLKSESIKENLFVIESIIKEYENKFDLSEYQKAYEILKLKYKDGI